jgi:thiosulfate dehydrogenase [quinone] large subunit
MQTYPAARQQNPGAHVLAGQGRSGLMGLLAVQAIIGYEWLVSGLAKIVRGDFVSGLREQLPDLSAEAPGWFKSILDVVVIPNATFFAVLIEVGELLIGVALIVTALLWALRFDRLPRAAHTVLMMVTGLAALSAILLAVSLHLLNGGTHPWFIPADAFDEGVDLDSLLPAIQLVLFVVSVRMLQRMRAQRPPEGQPNALRGAGSAQGVSEHGPATHA